MAGPKALGRFSELLDPIGEEALASWRRLRQQSPANAVSFSGSAIARGRVRLRRPTSDSVLGPGARRTLPTGARALLVRRLVVLSRATLLLAAACLVCGCHGDSNAGDPGHGGSPGSGGADSAGSGGGSTGVACEDAEEALAETSVALKNLRTHPIFVTADQTCLLEPPFELTGPDNWKVPLGADPCFGQRCVEMMKASPPPCFLICQAPPLIRIDPGGTHIVVWDAARPEKIKMAPECYFDPDDTQLYCELGKGLAAGTYTFTAKAAAECSYCQCVPDAGGSCVVTSGSAGEASLKATAVADLPASHIELVFE